MTGMSSGPTMSMIASAMYSTSPTGLGETLSTLRAIKGFNQLRPAGHIPIGEGIHIVDVLFYLLPLQGRGIMQNRGFEFLRKFAGIFGFGFLGTIAASLVADRFRFPPAGRWTAPGPRGPFAAIAASFSSSPRTASTLFLHFRRGLSHWLHVRAGFRGRFIHASCLRLDFSIL